MSGPITALPQGGFRVQLTNPTSGNWDSFIEDNAALAPREDGKLRVARPNARSGKHVVICGAGPSLRGEDSRRALENAIGQVWGCNSAMGWLAEHGLPVTHGFAIDQTDGLLNEWAQVENARYYLATSCNPMLVKHLLAHGKHVTFFHNFVGSPREFELYTRLWPSTVMVGDGLNSVNRAACLARFLGYARITILGADCGWKADEPFHANGDSPTAHGATPVVLTGEIDGRRWHTKPDMLFSAVALVKWARSMGNRVRIVGDTLVNALMDKPKAFLDRVAVLGDLDRMPGMTERAVPKGRDFVSDVFKG